MRIKRNIVLMCCISLLQGMVFYGPIATLYRQAAGLGIFQITLIESICLALSVALELPWGLVADRIGYRRTMLLCCLLYFLSKLVFWRADRFSLFLLERVMLAVVISGLSGVDVSVIWLSCEEQDAQRIFGLTNSLGTAGLLLAAGCYSLFIGGNYRLAGLLTCCSYGLAALLAFGLREVRPPARRRTGQLSDFTALLRSTLRDPALWMLLLGAALFGETHQTVTVFLNQLQYVRAGMSDRLIGVVYAAVTLAGLCGGLSARLTRGPGPRRSGALLCGGGALACLTLALTRSPLLSAAAVVLLRVCFSLFQPLQTDLQNRMVRTGDRATALSINAVLGDGVAILTNLSFGAVADRSLTAALLCGAGFCLGALLLWRAALRGRTCRPDPQTE